jgi:hypothetical protein
MKVKNAGKKGIDIGRTHLAPGQVVDVQDDLLFKPRQQRLKNEGVLVFPLVESLPPEKIIAVSDPTPVEVLPDDQDKKVTVFVVDNIPLEMTVGAAVEAEPIEELSESDTKSVDKKSRGKGKRNG